MADHIERDRGDSMGVVGALTITNTAPTAPSATTTPGPGGGGSAAPGGGTAGGSGGAGR
jgi:hypothetical protein